MKSKATIIGLGSYLPKKVLTNQDLEQMVETSDEWIITRTGMKERRIAAQDEFCSDMGTKAALKALEQADIQIDQIDLILVATITPDYLFPSTAALIQAQLKATKAAAFDIQAACTGFLYTLSLAKSYIENGTYQTILVVAAEKLSSIVNYQDRNTCVLFGDGAAAAVISHQSIGLRIQEVCLGTDGELASLLYMPAGGCRLPTSQETVLAKQHYIYMEGKEVFKHAVRRMESAIKECLAQANLKEEDINWLIPHQANVRIIEAIAKRFSIDDTRVYKTVHKYGNTSASSVPIALEELVRTQAVKEQEHIVLVAFGAGLTWGAAILEKVEHE